MELLITILNKKDIEIVKIEFREKAFHRSSKAFTMIKNIKFTHNEEDNEILIFDDENIISLFDHAEATPDSTIENKYTIELDFRIVGYLYISSKK